MLAQIRITPHRVVSNPTRFQLHDISLHDIFIPAPPPPLPPSSGWVAELEECGLLVRHHGPLNQPPQIPHEYLSDTYLDLFAQCSSASVAIDGELFPFLSPPDLTVVEDRRIGKWVPIVDLREFGGLAITHGDKGAAISFVDGTILWSVEELPSAIRQLQAEIGT